MLKIKVSVSCRLVKQSRLQPVRDLILLRSIPTLFHRLQKYKILENISTTKQKKQRKQKLVQKLLKQKIFKSKSVPAITISNSKQKLLRSGSRKDIELKSSSTFHDQQNI